MDAPDAAVAARARRAYERGRLDSALRRAVLAIPVLGLALLGCADPAASSVSGLALIAAVTLCLWRGESWRHGVGPGLLSGAVPLLVPLAAQAIGHLCSASRCFMDPTVCVVAGLAGSVGCLLYGLIGVGGMVIGLLAAAAPVVVLRRARG